MKIWTRRSFVLGGLLLGSVIGLGAAKLTCSFKSLPRGSGSTSALIADLYPASDALKLLGRAYLDETGDTAVSSLRRIERHERIQRALNSRCSYEVSSALNQVCRSDFRAGRTICIDGWILSQTELDVIVLCTIEWV
jgi:hypothetical protein